jgi:hypothetical protein
MPRGYRICAYITDSGQQYALLVDADSVSDANRGWFEIGAGVSPFAPRGFLPRQVVGRDETGRKRSTRVGRNDCALWTFTAPSWVLEGSDSQPHTITAVSRMQERQIAPQLPPP